MVDSWTWIWMECGVPVCTKNARVKERKSSVGLGSFVNVLFFPVLCQEQRPPVSKVLAKDLHNSFPLSSFVFTILFRVRLPSQRYDRDGERRHFVDRRAASWRSLHIFAYFQRPLNGVVRIIRLSNTIITALVARIKHWQNSTNRNEETEINYNTQRRSGDNYNLIKNVMYPSNVKHSTIIIQTIRFLRKF